MMRTFTILSLVAATSGVCVERPNAPCPVDLGGGSGGDHKGDDFVILAESGITTTSGSKITGNMGVSPITFASMTGWALTRGGSESGGEYASSVDVTGKIYAADFTGNTPTKMTAAIGHMHHAFQVAAMRTTSIPSAQFLNYKGGLIEGQTFTKGVYTWKTNVEFTSEITISGTATDVFIFQTTKDLVVGSGAEIKLEGAALAKNIFWQVAGKVEVGTTAHVKGIFLVKTHATFKTGSSLNGRVLSQTAVNLQSATVTPPPQPPTIVEDGP